MNIYLIGADGRHFDEHIATLDINTNFPISFASIVDPYIAMITQNGRLLLYEIDQTQNVNLTEVKYSSIFFHFFFCF